METIDRIDSKGNIREHIIREPGDEVTICGLQLLPLMTQASAGNATCRRCATLAAQLALRR